MNCGSRVRRRSGGLTLVELTVAMLASSVMLLGLVGILAGNQKDYNKTFERVNGDIERNAREARAIFDRAVRGATYRKCRIGASNEYLEVYYYRTMAAPALNGYARFYVSNGQLLLERGQLIPGTFLYSLWNNPTTQLVAEHVTSCTFSQAGPCVSMSMVLADGGVSLPVVVTATRHNE